MRALLTSITCSACLTLLAGNEGFIPNKGQIHDHDQHRKLNPAVKYLLNGAGMNVQLRSDGFAYDTYLVEEGERVKGCESESVREQEVNGEWEMVNGANAEVPTSMTYRFHRIDLHFVNGDPNAEMISEGESEDYLNYYTDVTGEAGATFIHHYSKITYKEVWPNIDVRCVAGEEGFKYDVIVRPGGDLSQVRFKVEGAQISENLNGSLVFTWGSGSLEETIPESWMENGRRKSRVDARYAIATNGTFGFATEQPATATLVIDPFPTNPWATYCGGSSYDYGYAVALDGSDNGYLAGYSYSTSTIATSGTHDATHNGSADAMLIKYSPTGTKLWGTYYGGSGSDVGRGVTVDPGGMPSICGSTSSNLGIATAGAHQGAFAGGFSDAFLARFHVNGTRMWGTYMGGSDTDVATGIVVSGAGLYAISGYSNSVAGIASAGAADATYSGDTDAFVAQFTGGGTRSWSTYLGGSGHDIAEGITFTGSYPVVCGYTTSTSGITLGATYDFTHNGLEDAFVVRYTGSGSKTRGTYFGGSGNDRAYGAAYSMLNRVVIVGSTGSTSGIASPGAAQPSFGGQNTDGMIACFDLTNLNRVWSTYCGGGNETANELLRGVAATSGGSVAVTGSPISGGLGTADSWQPNNNNGSSQYRTYVAGYSSVGGKQWAGYAHVVYGLAVAGSASSVLVTGSFFSSDPPVVPPNAFQPLPGGVSDAYLFKLDLTGGSATAPVATNGSAPSAKAIITNDQLRIVDAPTDGTMQLTVLDAAGREQFTHPWQQGVTIALPPILAPGIYIASLQGADGSRHLVRFVIP